MVPTFLRQRKQLWSSVWRQWWPPSYMNILSLSGRMVFQQWLAMLPTSQASNPFAEFSRCNIDQTVPRTISKDCALHMRGFELASSHEDFTIRVNQRLCNVDRIIVVFRKAQRHHYAVSRCTLLNFTHLIRINDQRVLNIPRRHDRVNWSGPVCIIRLAIHPGGRDQ